jgi:hypothetical protein
MDCMKIVASKQHFQGDRGGKQLSGSHPEQAVQVMDEWFAKAGRSASLRDGEL